jgi:dTDP-4-amino-4,6-dideoxygalactose transaminase
VIVPAQTHTATAHAVEVTGARPVFVDAERTTGNIDIDAIEAAITPRTKGISVVHYLGEPVDMPRVMAIAARHGLFVLEDCALGVGSTIDGTHVGLQGDAGAFSFYPVKHLTTAEGGMVITRHADVADKLTRQRAFGVDRTPSERSVPGVYDVTQLGFNYRMNEIQAAIGIEQMKRIDGFLAVRRRNWEALCKGLDGVDGLSVLPASDGARRSGCYCLSAVLAPEAADRRPEIVARLTAEGIGTSVYYPRPVPMFSYYQERYGHRAEEFPVASWLSSSSIALPVGPHLDIDDMTYIAEALDRAMAEETA